jgi:hypothetical protein
MTVSERQEGRLSVRGAEEDVLGEEARASISASQRGRESGVEGLRPVEEEESRWPR